MTSPPPALRADWLGASRRAAQALREVLEARPTIKERAEETGTLGEGGDRTLLIDSAAEDLVFAQLDALHSEGHRFVAMSEERGEVDYGDPEVRVVIDPIDGSLNAKRGIPGHSMSIAVADGVTMADIDFGFVYDFGANEEWTARRGKGARLDGRLLPPDAGERRWEDGRLEVVGIESADPRRLAATIGALGPLTHRLRSVGSIAITLCSVSAARFDGMVTLSPTRAVDAAAGQLIVREGGGLVAFPAFDPPLSAPLDAAPHSPVAAARTESSLEELAELAMAE
ncbi:MAG: inositol monophosphatase family protein [Solirubrobacteraceae bacterium]